MFIVTNNRASRIKLKNGKVLGRGQSAEVSANTIADANLSRLAARGKVSISRKLEPKEFVKYGVEPEVKKPEVEKPEVEKPEVEKPEVKKPEVEKPEVEKPEVKLLEVKSEGKTIPKKEVPKPESTAAVEKVDEDPKKPTVKRRGRRKSASTNEG
jgi:hypothetical protein